MKYRKLDSKFGILGIMGVSGQRISNASVVGLASAGHEKPRQEKNWQAGFWRLAVLSAAGVLGAASQADAALYYWQDSDPGLYRPGPSVQPRRQRPSRRPSKAKDAVAEKDTGAKPQGPLIISISIEQQKVRVYDSNGLFAEGPVSTGMKGHATPMGVFSVIQKHKLHHSNIYSGAPMPFMQRITWSGVAMHAGVLPGYPASHGCIRMPMAFATKMWNWTKMGARVIVTPGEITPANFSHPLLVAQKVVPQPVIADEPKTDVPAVKSDKGADAGAASKPSIAETSLELRSTVGHTSAREQTRTADASGSMPQTSAVVTMSDAAPSTSSMPKQGNVAAAEANPEAQKSEPMKTEATPAQLEETPTADVKPAETAAPAAEAKKIDEAQAPAPAAGDAVKTDAAVSETATADSKLTETKAEKVEAKSDEVKSDEVKSDVVKSDDVKPEAPKADIAKIEPAQAEPVQAEPPKVDTPKAEEPKAAETKAVEKAAEPVKETAKEAAKETAKAVADAPAVAPDAKKDPARLPGVAAVKPDAPKRTGQIAVFVSRKDSKLYVRQNFAPLFEVPVTIAPSERPLGTHVFTAEADKKDPNLLRWSVVTLPVTARNAARNEDDDRPARRRKMAGGAPAEVKPLPQPDSPAEALDRITVPQDAMARIADALTTGGSIVVSDQGITQGETGEGTDFIVSLH